MNPLPFAFAAAAVSVIGVFLSRWYITRLTDRRIFAFQHDLITKHCAEVEHIYNQMRGWKHDYHNHMQALKAHLSLEQYAEIGAYLQKLDNDLTSVDTIVKTGNTMVDAILNSKLSLAKTRGIAVNAKATAPKTSRVAETDLCVVVGNLLDNAMEACARVNEETPRIRVYMGLMKEQLYISVSNTTGPVTSGKPMSGTTQNKHGYPSTKGVEHGFGLMRVDAVARKYNGYVNRKHEEGVFATEIMLPL